MGDDEQPAAAARAASFDRRASEKRTALEQRTPTLDVGKVATKPTTVRGTSRFDSCSN
jgi:hypothetical protein